jgi:rhamnulokinase
MRQFAAVDLGASSGRVMVGTVGSSALSLSEVHRFRNVPVLAGGTLHWDILRLYADMLDGLRAAARDAELSSIGIDSWAIDYGLLAADGTLLGNPVHYRDARTADVAALVHRTLPASELYATTGTAQLPFNTIYQLAASAGTAQLRAAQTLLLVPDLLAYWLTGEIGAEITNASTTGLLDATRRSWANSIATRAGIPERVLPPLRSPGEAIGLLGGSARPGEAVPPMAGTPLVAVASHDTASAVVAVPARPGRNFAYISSGTWSLAGVELDRPVLTEASRLAGFTNEAGLDGTVRYLRNLMGLWLLQESARCWAAEGRPVQLGELLAAAARAEPLRAVINPDDPVFLPPGDMPSRISAACTAAGQPVPSSPAEFARCILDSLALASRRAIIDVQELSGQRVDAVHIVGGGARNELLCQLTADACGLPVLAGPVEAAALGNVLVQARACGVGPADLAGLRALVRATQDVRSYVPDHGARRGWESAATRGSS